ncbi:MAG: YqiA/YcfP family alpha/beta fold hydrolase [Verrucomicrobiota bacterium]
MRYLYLHGFASGPTSEKAAFLRERFAEQNLTLETPNLAPGDFSKLTLTNKLNELAKTLATPPTLEGSAPALPRPAKNESSPTASPNNPRPQDANNESAPPTAASGCSVTLQKPEASPYDDRPHGANAGSPPPTAASGCNVTLLGSSLGGYVATLYAHQHPDHIHQLILLAPAFGFPTRWLESEPPEAIAAWQKTGSHTVYHHGLQQDAQIGYQLVTDAQQYPDYPTIPPTIPTLIIHGKNDETVPIESSHHFLRINTHATLVELDADHRLTQSNTLRSIWQLVADALDPGVA